MATNYNGKVLDILAAFGADGFWYGSGGFHRTSTHDVGSLGWPWEFSHRWEVLAAPATRDALVRQGWIEPLSRAVGMGDRYRVTSRALALLADEHTASWKLSRSPWHAFLTASAAAEADNRAHPHTTRRV